MNIIRIGISIINPTIGRINDNSEIIKKSIDMARKEDIDILVFPELALCGYPLEDLILWNRFVDESMSNIVQLIPYSKNMTVLVGHVFNYNQNNYNAVSVFHNQKLLGLTFKENLPTYNVFYEGRTFARGEEGFVIDVSQFFPKLNYSVFAGDLIYDIDSAIIAPELCEDMWTGSNASSRRCYSGAEIVINCSASPFRGNISLYRENRLAVKSSDCEGIYIYNNLLGGNGRLVFDGGGYVYQNGLLNSKIPYFKEGLFSFDVDVDITRTIRTENTTFRSSKENFFSTHKPTYRINASIEKSNSKQNNTASYSNSNFVSSFGFIDHQHQINTKIEFYDSIVNALILGTSDYYKKTRAFNQMIVALSGGKDSALCAFIAREAMLYLLRKDGISEYEIVNLLPQKVKCFYLSTKHSSEDTYNVSKLLTEQLNLGFNCINIEDEFNIQLMLQKLMLKSSESISDTAYQNTQARIRGSLMWNYSNSTNSMIIVTSNLSEAAVGYTTLGGDEEGCFAPIINLPKTFIIELIDYIAEKYSITALYEINKMKPTAELKDGQFDEVDLMPYSILDRILYLFAGQKKSPEDIIKLLPDTISHDDKVKYVKKFLKLFFANQYKREQFPVGLKLFDLDLDPKTGFRFPVVQSNDWLHLDKLE